MSDNFVTYKGITVPKIVGAGGGKGGGGKIAPNSLFSTDILFVTNAIGEGPVYRINPNGPQDIQIQDSTIDDLINLDGDGNTNTDKFVVATTPGTAVQDPLPFFGDKITTPQVFSSPVTLKKGNLEGVPSSGVTLQETSANDWDALRFNFMVDSLVRFDDKGNASAYTVGIKLTLYDRLGENIISTFTRVISGKSDTAFKISFLVNIAYGSRSLNGYRFSVEKTTNDNEDPKIQDAVKLVGWDEIKNIPQAYPRTSLIGYAIKAVDEHTGGVPNFTNLLKGLLVRVPSNYNQPVLSDGQIDWRELEVGLSADPSLYLSFSSGDASYTNSTENKFDYTNTGYKLQQTGPEEVLYDPYPTIYRGTWDGTFVYSWTQNPVWILYDILTNRTYGLGVAEENIDKFKFYQAAQYCDACDSVTGRFYGVKGVSDGSFRYKPNGYYASIRENQIGIAKGYIINERRFISDISIVDQEKALDVVNKIAATFRAIIIYSGGKISLAVDMPEEYPVMLFNDTNIRSGSMQISGTKESEIYTGVDVTYIEPTNHFKREVIRIDADDYNRGFDYTNIENILSLDLPGVTRRSQAVRTAQYQLASSKYLKRNVSFITNTDALNLASGDVISVSTTSSGIAYGYGGKVTANSNTAETSVMLEHFTVPPLSNSTFTSNTNPLTLRILKPDSDRIDLYILSNTSFNLYSTGNVSSGADIAEVFVTKRFDPLTKTIVPISSFTSNIVPQVGDLWSIGEITNPSDYFSSKSGKLFKVTGLSREPESEDITVSAIEYVSNIYVDSDTYTNYEPTAYVDITSPFATPPAPDFTFTTNPRVKLDGSVVIDGRISAVTEILDYEQKITTEYYIANPDQELIVQNVISTSPLTLQVNSTDELSEAPYAGVLYGKNGFSSLAGEIKLLCTSYSIQDLEFIELNVDGLSDCFDFNFNTHILEANDGEIFGNLKGIDKVTVPVVEKANTGGLANFVGYRPQTVSLSREITSYDAANNTIRIENSISGASNLFNSLPNTPFYVSINQTLAKDYYANNIFYLSGAERKFLVENSISSSASVVYVDLPVTPRTVGCLTLYVDGIQKSTGQFTYNANEGIANPANVVYATSPGDSSYSLEICYYTAPAIDLGDNVEISYANTFSVINTSYSTDSALYNASATANSVYYIELARSPSFDISSYSFTNITNNPVGTISNVTSNTVTFDYDSNRFPGLFSAANNAQYALHVNSAYESLYFSDDSIIPELNEGVTVVRARNKNRLGRVSPFVEKSVTVRTLPIQKVQNLILTESLYKEQTGGVAVRVTAEFDHIVGQEVTDYEISYRLGNVDDLGVDDGGAGLTFYNTVKVPAQGVEDDGKIRFTVNNINRGETSESNSITVRVTPLNRALRGVTATKSLSIVGKAAPPQNVYNFTGGQQTDQITLFWAYRRVNEQLADLDLKEVIVRRLAGSHESTLENFLAASDLVTVSAGSGRKSIPIDTFGTFTYLVRTRDTSGNLSEDVVSAIITTTRPQRTTTVAAYSEDDPSTQFSSIPNTNASEYYFPSFANSTGGLAAPGADPVDNANGSSSGWSAVGGAPTDLLADQSAEYITQIRSFDTTIVGQITVDLESQQSIQTSYNDQHEEYLESVSDYEIAPDDTFVRGSVGALANRGNNLFATAIVQFPSTPAEGCLFEAGGAGVGCYVGLRDSGATLRVRFGSGATALANSSTNATVLDITDFPTDNNHHHIAWDFNTSNGNARLWIDNELKGLGYNIGNNAISWSGGDTGGYGEVVSGVTVGEPSTDWPGDINNNLFIYYNTLAFTSASYANVLIDADFGGIGHILGYSNAAVPAPRYDSNNRTWMTGGASGNVWGIWNHGQYVGDSANANSYALIAGVINANAIALGASFYANGEPLSSNAFANVVSQPSTYTLVNFIQYNDTGPTNTYQGDLGSVKSQTFVRTATGDAYYANGNVNVSAFGGSADSDGFIPYEAGTKVFRHFQLKHVVTNIKPDEFDLTLDKFRYTVDKEQTVYSNTVVYDSSPKTVDYRSANYFNRPVISYAILDQIDAQANPAVVVTTAASNQEVSFTLVASDGSGPYLANSTANIMITAVGV